MRSFPFIFRSLSRLTPLPCRLFFNYEISPLMVIHKETRQSLAHFLTSTCAIVGGVLTIASLVECVFFLPIVFPSIPPSLSTLLPCPVSSRYFRPWVHAPSPSCLAFACLRPLSYPAHASQLLPKLTFSLHSSIVYSQGKRLTQGGAVKTGLGFAAANGKML